jgi:hypothetical protein
MPSDWRLTELKGAANRITVLDESRKSIPDVDKKKELFAAFP